MSRQDVQFPGGLVEHEQGWPVQQGPGDLDLPSVPARQRLEGSLRERVQSEPRQQDADPFVDLPLRETIQSPHVTKVTDRAPTGLDHDVLGAQEPHAPPLVGSHRRDGLPPESNVSLRRP